MDPLRWCEHATQDGRHIRENGRSGGYAEVPAVDRAVAAAIILWGCVMISFAWVTFLVLVILKR